VKHLIASTRAKYLIVAVISCLVLGAAVALGFFLFGGKELRYTTQAALLRAVPPTATDELRTRGVQLAAPLSCASIPGATPKRMRVACTGKANGGRRVQVFGAGEDKTQDQYFTILVDGHPIVQNAGCLGADCRKD
jgi:hypothetical protein